jgi:hypothetical protein
MKYDASKSWSYITMYEMRCKHAVQISYTYCNGFDQRIARQQLGKHLPLVLHDNNWESMGERILQLVSRQQFCRQCNKQHWELGSLWPVARLRNNRTVFSMWSVPGYTEIPRINDAVEKRIGSSAVQFAAVSELWRLVEYRIGQRSSEWLKTK